MGTDTDTFAPGSPAWMKLITASKVASIMGVSNFESPAILWHRMTGTLPPDAENDQMRRGHYLEPAILQWFFDKHPEMTRGPSEIYFHETNKDFAATPDAVARVGEQRHPIEAKSDHDGDDWGTPGTDEIPIKYVAQCTWALHVMGLQRAYLPMIGPFLRFEEYVVDYSAELAQQIEAKVLAFQKSLADGIPPELSDHPKEYETLRRLHPSINLDYEVNVDADLAYRFIEAKQSEASASKEWTAAKAAMNAVMQEASRAYHDGQLIAVRQAKGAGIPYVTAPRKLPTLEGLPA